MRTVIQHHKIYHADSVYEKEIGYLQLIKVDDICQHQIEYYLDDEYHNKGLMSFQLPIYLDKIHKAGIETVTALVEKHNIASQKLLLKNDFVKLPIRSTIYFYYKKLGREDVMKELKKLLK